MLVNFQLQKKDIRRIISEIGKEIKILITGEISERINNQDFSVDVARNIEKACEKHFDILKSEIQELVREEVKIQLRGKR